VTAVEDGLEDLDFLTGDLRAPEPPDELFALPAEHAAGDDFDPPRLAARSMLAWIGVKSRR
jgi:hypothetical protein